MPVEFLSDEEAAAYGGFVGTPSSAELARWCLLDDADLRLVNRRRVDHLRLGFALQLVTVRALGLFLVDPLDVPTAVLDDVAAQLEVADPSCVKRYTDRRPTRFDHQGEIAAAEGYRDFADAAGELERWVDDRAFTAGEGPKGLVPRCGGLAARAPGAAARSDDLGATGRPRTPEAVPKCKVA